MEVITDVIGNINMPEWKGRLADAHVETVWLDQWTAQKSRFLATSDHGNEYPVALRRHVQVKDGDIILYDAGDAAGPAPKAVVLRLDLSPVLVVDLEGIAKADPDTVIRTSLELGHAIGNQHWPAVVKGTKVYVPLTVDQKVMLAVLETHNIPGITFKFEKGQEVIPYLAPAELRRLFGGAGHESHEAGHEHEFEHLHPHVHPHTH